jgi:DNA adenine methylase
VTNDDFERVFHNAKHGTFMFIDPPYYKADQSKFYTCYFSLSDHERLVKTINQHRNKIKFLLTYDDCEEIRDMYKQYCVREANWNYTIARTDDQKNKKKLSDGHKGKRKSGSELFISNYSLEQ